MKITLNNVCKSIQGAQILKDISLEFESAHIYGLYGANGSGKTMLMRAVAGLMKIDGGHVIIDGSEIGKDQDFPDSIGFIIENPSFLNTYTGFENLKLIAELKLIAADKSICDALERVGLDPKDMTMEVIESRMNRACEEAEGMSAYDYLVVNDELDDCVEEMHSIIQGEHHRSSRNVNFMNDIKEELEELKGEN